jgi:hypothetical protein
MRHKLLYRSRRESTSQPVKSLGSLQQVQAYRPPRMPTTI